MESLFVSLLVLLPVFLFGTVFIGISGAAFLIIKHTLVTAKDGETALRQLIQDFRLTVTRGPHNTKILKGHHQGIPLTVYQTRRTRLTSDYDDHRQRYIYTTHYIIALNPQHVPPGLRIYRESFSSKLSKLVGTKDIQLNDKDFDTTFIIQGNSDHEVHAFFDRPNIKEYFLSFHAGASNFYLQDNTLHIESERQMIFEAPVLRHRLEKLVQCAHAIHGQPALPHTPTPALSAPLENTNAAW